MAELRVVDKIQLQNRNEIQLAFGSVTKIGKDEEADVLVVSAFPNDYSPTTGSVIGALKKDLDVNVELLAKDKDQDLREICSSWLSKPLSGQKGFKRLLCFEGGSKKPLLPPMVVSDVFSSLDLLCGNKNDLKVVMPLLASGDQEYDKFMMLSLIVNSAVAWAQVGNHLKIIKIVIYAPTLHGVDRNPLLCRFRQLKKNIIKEITMDRARSPLTVPMDYDIFLSYNKHDASLANAVVTQLTNRFDRIRVCYKRGDSGVGNFDCGNLRQRMLTCGRFIAILSSKYFSDPSCIEEYNTALCIALNKRQGPCFLTLPVYLAMNPHDNDRRLDEMKIDQACSEAIDFLKHQLSEMIVPEKPERKQAIELHDTPTRECPQPDKACENDEVPDVRPIQEERKTAKTPVENIDMDTLSEESYQVL